MIGFVFRIRVCVCLGNDKIVKPQMDIKWRKINNFSDAKCKNDAYDTYKSS